MTKIAGSGSESGSGPTCQRHGSAHLNEMDPITLVASSTFRREGGGGGQWAENVADPKQSFTTFRDPIQCFLKHTDSEDALF
jgi:hypothetical protein